MKTNYKLPIAIIAGIAASLTVSAFAEDVVEIQRTHDNGEVTIGHRGETHSANTAIEITHGETIHHRDKVVSVTIDHGDRHWVRGHDAVRHGEEVWIPGHYVRD